MEAKIGRNDPCPCGSGKKYKKCCGLLRPYVKPDASLFTRYNQLFSTIKIKLDNFYGNEIRKNRKDIMTYFISMTVDHILPTEHESIFSDWLWFDYQGSTGITAGNRYMQDNITYMENPLLECIQGLNKSYLSVYETKECSETSLTIKDIFTGQLFRVLIQEPLNTNDDLLLCGRLVHLENNHIFSGMVLLSNYDIEKISFLQHHFNYLKELYNQNEHDLLKTQGETIYALFDHATKKTLFSLNDIKAIEINSTQKKTLIEWLSISSEYTLVHETEGCLWFIPEHSHHGYVRLIISDKHLITCADVIDDIKLLDSIIAKKLPLAKVIIINNNFVKQPPTYEFSDLWFTVMKDQQCEKWLNMPHPELDNKTPFDVIHDPKGRESLLNMLDRHFNMVKSDDEKELLEYLRQRIKKSNP